MLISWIISIILNFLPYVLSQTLLNSIFYTNKVFSLNALMDSSFLFDTTDFGSSIVYIEGSLVIISK